MTWKTVRYLAIALFAGSVLVYSVLFLACLDCRTAPQVERMTIASKEELGQPKYIGCHLFAEHSLVYLVEQNNNMTVTLCLSVCYRSDYDFALLLSGDRCYCSSVGGTGALQTEDRCASTCSGNSTQNCGGAASASVYELRIRNGIREWTTWMTMEGSSLHKRYRGCILDANSTCSIQTETKTSGKLEDWENDLRPHFVGCFTTASIISEAVTRSMPINDWPLNARECMSDCWWSYLPYASIVTMGSNRECVCTSSLANSIPINTCVDMYGAHVFVLFSYIQADKLRFSAAVAQRKVLLLGYLQSNQAYVHAVFKSQPKTFYTHGIDLLLKESSGNQDGNGSSVPAAAVFGGGRDSVEATVPIHEVLNPFYRCNVYRMSSTFLHWREDGASRDSGYSNYINCTRMVYGDLGYAKCLPFLEESCKTSSLVVGTASTLLHQRNLEQFVWNNPSVHIIHVIRDPLRVLMSAEQALLKGQNITKIAQQLCSQVLATSDYFQKQIWTKRLHTLFYEETALSASKVIKFASRNLAWNLTDTNLPGGHAGLVGDLGDASGSTEVASLPPPLLDTTHLAVRELGRQQCAAFYKTFPRRYRAPGDPSADKGSPMQDHHPSNKGAVQSNQLKLQQDLARIA